MISGLQQFCLSSVFGPARIMVQVPGLVIVRGFWFLIVATNMCLVLVHKTTASSCLPLPLTGHV
jgi:hypothetical protein